MAVNEAEVLEQLKEAMGYTSIVFIGVGESVTSVRTDVQDGALEADVDDRRAIMRAAGDVSTHMGQLLSDNYDGYQGGPE